MIVQRTFLSVSYTVHIRFVRYTSVTRTLIGHSLSVSCSVRMCSLRLSRQHSPPLRRLPSPDKHFLQIFCPFGVRYLYPYICDSTINIILDNHNRYILKMSSNLTEKCLKQRETALSKIIYGLKHFPILYRLIH